MVALCKALTGEAQEQLEGHLTDLMARSTDTLIARELSSGLTSIAATKKAAAEGSVRASTPVSTSGEREDVSGNLRVRRVCQASRSAYVCEFLRMAVLVMPWSVAYFGVCCTCVRQSLPADVLRSARDDLVRLAKWPRKGVTFDALGGLLRCGPEVASTLCRAATSGAGGVSRRVSATDVKKMLEAVEAALGEGTGQGAGSGDDEDGRSKAGESLASSVTSASASQLPAALPTEVDKPTPFLVIKNVARSSSLVLLQPAADRTTPLVAPSPVMRLLLVPS